MGPQQLRALRRHLVLSPVAKGPGIESRGAVITAMEWCKVHVTVSIDGSLPELNVTNVNLTRVI